MRKAHHVKHPNYRTVWATLQEVSAMHKETDLKMKETDRIVKENAEQIKETDRQIKETDRQMRETDRQMKETDKRLGKLTNRLGEAVEYMVAPNLQEKFRGLGLNFPGISSNSVISDYDNNIFLEIDVKLENGDKAMLVEIKTNLTIEDVKEHINRLEKIRVYADLHGDRRAFLGAVAGVVIKQNVKDYALAQGFYVVEPSGETFNITVPDGIYSPREW